MRVFIIALLATACVPSVNTSDLRRCDADDPLVDCCSDADQCLTYYGESFQFCVNPGETTGQCVECTVNEHCELDAYCNTDDMSVGPYCAPLPPEGS